MTDNPRYVNWHIPLPFGWVVIFHAAMWKDKDGTRCTIQLWHASRRGFLISRFRVMR